MNCLQAPKSPYRTGKKLEKSLKGYVLVQKLLERNGCNAYTMPCPDCCSTRRLNQEQLTFCLTHSLNNENQIPSSCEMDINSVLAMAIMENLSDKAVYMGNSNPVLYHDGQMIQMQGFGQEQLAAATDERENLYLVFHSTPNRKLHGYKENTETEYSLAPFANDQDLEQQSDMILPRMQVRKYTSSYLSGCEKTVCSKRNDSGRIRRRAYKL